MKSLKETLGFARTVASIDGMPKNATGFLSHLDEAKLNNLWIDIIKAEEAYLKLSLETVKYCCSLKEIQSTEEKLLKLIGDSNIGLHSPTFREIADEYLSVVIECKKCVDESSSIAHEVTGTSPDQYHAIYEHLDTFKKQRDGYISEIEKCQEKFDRFKLKGKRTTDVLVEKEKNLRHFRAVNQRLTNEAEKFHDLRMQFLHSCIQASVRNQVNYYGNLTSEFSKYIQTSRGAHQQKDSQYMNQLNSHLDKIKQLTIVDQ